MKQSLFRNGSKKSSFHLHRLDLINIIHTSLNDILLTAEILSKFNVRVLQVSDLFNGISATGLWSRHYFLYIRAQILEHRSFYLTSVHPISYLPMRLLTTLHMLRATMPHWCRKRNLDNIILALLCLNFLVIHTHHTPHHRRLRHRPRRQRRRQRQR